MNIRSILLVLLSFITSVANAAVVSIHYHRPNSDYSAWGIHLWAGEIMQNGRSVSARTDFRLRSGTTASKPMQATRFDEFGAVFVIPVRDDARQFSYMITNGKEFYLNQAEQKWNMSEHGNEIWLVEGHQGTFKSQPNVAKLLASKPSPATTPSRQESAPAPRLSLSKDAVLASKEYLDLLQRFNALKSEQNSNSEFIKAKQEIVALNKQLASSNRELAQLRRALTQAKTGANELKSDLKDNAAQYQDLSDENTLLRAELKQLTIDKQQLLSQVNRIDTQEPSIQLQEQTKLLEENLSQRELAIAQLEAKLADAEQKAQQFDLAEEKIASLQQQNTNINSELLTVAERSKNASRTIVQGLAWWWLAVCVGVLLCIGLIIYLVNKRKFKAYQHNMDELMRAKDDELRVEKIYSAASKEKLRKVLQGDAPQHAWSTASKELPEHLRKEVS